MANIVVEYKREDRWSRVVAAPGETYEECCESLQRLWPEVTEFRRHESADTIKRDGV